ncbi:MAG: hypothetical protein ACRDHY_05150, partial [Anaerolineales bacterium]
METTELDDRVEFVGTFEERETASWRVSAGPCVIDSSPYGGSKQDVRPARRGQGMPGEPHTPELESLQTLDGQFVGQVHDRFFPELYR